MNEADTCRLYVTPKLQAAGWEDPPHSMAEQTVIAPGRIVPVGQRAVRKEARRPDYLLRYAPNQTIAVVEAKRLDKPAGTGLQQAREYAQILGVQFAYATNGREIMEFDLETGLERELDAFPTPAQLWRRWKMAGGFTAPNLEEKVLTPYERVPGKQARYYQEIAINRAVQAILKGQTRLLLTMATGTGKTFLAFQICHRLWRMRWNRTGQYYRPKILFLADRNVLVDDPKDKMFWPFGDARHKIQGEAIKSRDMYFATYQSIARDERRPGLYRDYPPNFFDLIVVDECHRGSARGDSNWREILEHFYFAVQLGLTATPLREDNRDTYDYFGMPLYTYSLRQGIEDGFLAPYRVYQIRTDIDVFGWSPDAGQIDRYGREIPDGEYQTKDFERAVALKARTEAIAEHLTGFLKHTDRFAKTLVFCVDQEHADEMRRALNNRNRDLVQDYPDYVCRVTSEEGDIGRGHLSNFQDPERTTPVILTTFRLLTTGVDVPTCKNVVLARVVGSMTEFKQIIGRGTRVAEEHGKLFFNILDYTGSATVQFTDPDFDGYPVEVAVEELEGGSAEGERVDGLDRGDGSARTGLEPGTEPEAGQPGEPRKFYVDDGRVEIVAEMVRELDIHGNQLRTVSLTEYTGETIRTLYNSDVELRQHWADPTQRTQIVARLAARGIDLDHLRQAANQPDADPFDLLCHLAYSAPLRTRRERVAALRRRAPDFFEQYAPQARQILDEMLAKYAEHGPDQFQMPDVLRLPPISTYGNSVEISTLFGGAESLRTAILQLQTLLYTV